MLNFLSHHVYVQEFVAALAMLGLGLEGCSVEQELPATDEFTSGRTP